MSASRFRRVFVVLGLALFAAPAAAQFGSITGRVTAADGGRPVAGARVEARISGTTAGSATTDDNGQFRIVNLAEGSYSVIATRIGYQVQRVDGVGVGTGIATADVTMSRIPSILDQVVTTASRAPEKVLDAPASVSVVTEKEINERPSITVTDHIAALPGIDVARGGLMQANIVARGFNNIFSGSMLTLTDNRFAYVPSLRVNIPYLIPTNNEDIERIELVLGPGAALYGPNAAGGVLHVITKSPFASEGTTLTIDGGEREVFRGGARTAGALGEKFGYKLSYDSFRGNDWRPAERDTLERVPRDFRLRRQGGEARVDFRPTTGSEITATYGRAVAGNAVEPTGLGPAQVRDWMFNTYQLRARVGRLFAQTFLNTSDAGNTFLLRTLQPIVDKSTQVVGQAQHGLDLGSRQSFIYGFDYQHTVPKTEGSINGRNEDDDDITEIGGYLHSITRFTPKLELVSAARLDNHSRLAENVFSPRVALVFKPTENQNLRATFNRAFSTPSTNNLFLDLLAGRIPTTGTQLYGVRALGVPASGFTFKRDCAGGLNSLCMRVPTAFGGTGTQIPAAAALLYRVAVGAASARLIAGGVPASLVSYMASLQPTPAQVSTQLRILNTANGSFVDVAPTDVRDVAPITPTTNSTFELGYKADIASRLRLSMDLWREQRRNFVGPLIVETPNVFLDRATLQAYLTAQLTPVVGAATAAAVAAGVAPALAGISGSSTVTGVPLGVVNFDHPLSSASDVIVTYRNFGKLSVWGTDFGAEWLIGDRYSVVGTLSHVSKDFFPRTEIGGVQDISLNAPRSKGSLAGRFSDVPKGMSAELRFRAVTSFPVYSFINGNIKSYQLFDAGFSFRPAVLRGALWAINGTNIFNNKHTEFVGGGEIGRLVMTRLQATF
ncbi:MAG: TonB-dependent receptor [Gemmatimonadaceae bacterium]